jgi:ATP-dependent helicase/nuclease subunit B
MNGTDQPVELPRPIVDALDRGATVITANQRAARTIRYAFDKRNRSLGLTSWQPARAIAWDVWTADLWRNLLLEGHTADLLLNRTQEHLIWRSILSADPELQDTLRSTDSLSELAADAWRLLARYDGQHRLNDAGGHAETRAFQRWAAGFHQRCRRDRLLPQGSLESALQALVEAGKVRVSAEIVLVGFDELTPAQRNLIEALAASGSHIEALPIATESLSRTLVSADDEHEEIYAAARWARRLIQQQPHARIGIIVPSLEARRAIIDRILREELSPELEDIAAPNNIAPYEFSLGIKLDDTPMVRTALDLLRWMAGLLPIEHVSALLVSPLFAMASSERDARASFDAFELRKAKILRPEISIAGLADDISRSERRAMLTQLLKTLRSMGRAAEKTTEPARRQSYGAWADTLGDLLKTAHWGRDTGEDSIEFQTRRKWEGLLDELATLDFDAAQATYQQVIAVIERLARLTLFAPESRQTPIQVLGPLEAAGESFDAIWFVGAGDLTWPGKTSSSPLLPWPLQRELGMPGTDSAADDARVRHVVERIAACAPVSIFSYAVESSEGKQRPSAVLDVLQLLTAPISDIAPRDSEPESVALEEFADSALPSLPDRVIHGGADILRLQAACGFRAFAERRLWSTEMRTIELGMDAGERGNIVHRTLEYFWREEATSQAELKAMTAEERSAALDRAIEHGLRRAAVDPKGWDLAYVDVQRKRLSNLLGAWLELELKRDSFSVKLSEETIEDARIGPLRLKLRVDRVDVGENGGIIIDYKTGQAKPSDWQGDRPNEPQLPLYAVLAADAQSEIPLTDVAFAHIRPAREMSLEGFTDKVTAERRRARQQPRPLADQIDSWREVLTTLAEAFHQGDVRVDPKEYPKTCSNCGQRTLCRLNPADFDEDLDDEEANDIGNG